MSCISPIEMVKVKSSSLTKNEKKTQFLILRVSIVYIDWNHARFSSDKRAHTRNE